MLLEASKRTLFFAPTIASSSGNPRLLRCLTRHLQVAPLLLLPTSSIAITRAHSTCSQLRMAVADPPVVDAAARAQQPPWSIPTKVEPEPELVVYNSLTKTKTPFVPMRGRHITWYNCGPTVYDASHMGHARNYVSQDILRRILLHLGYSVQFVMNITDIDDKIITRARQNHLLDNFRSQNPHMTSAVLSQVREAWSAFLNQNIISNEKIQKAVPLDPTAKDFSDEGAWEVLSRLNGDAAKQSAIALEEPKYSMYFSALDRSRQAIIAAAMTVAATNGSSSSSSSSAPMESSKDLIDASVDMLSYSLDKAHGHSVSESSPIFRALAAKWETSYFEDMKRLNVLPPSQLTRVSEYVPEIVTYIEKIISNGFAYADVQGNVWFDTNRFDGGETSDGDKFSYARLAPGAKNNQKLLEEGEGSLSTSDTTTQGKRSPSDFALWKSSKPGEPSWPSTWGRGRPGWHIECSVMASEVLGTRIDIHSGGVDLMFPHHDNELAQSEAHNGCSPWINYFLHTGHLDIKGQKMSKSLKNFISIEEALRNNTARQLRLSFLMSTWSSGMQLQDSTMPEAERVEKQFESFFRTVKAQSRSAANRGESWSDGQHHYGEAEKNLVAVMTQAQMDFPKALCDSFDTPTAMRILLNLVSAANVYEKERRSDVNAKVLENLGRWVGDMLRMFGLGEGPVREGDIGWGNEGSEGAGSELDRESILLPYLNALSKFRSSVRALALQKAPHIDLLKLADQLRDQDLVDLGVALEDFTDGTAMVKLVPAERLRAERDEKLKAAEDKLKKKEEREKKEADARRERLTRGAISEEKLFRPKSQGGLAEEGEWSEWDEKGLPTKDGQGEPVSKGKQKGFQKELVRHAKLRQEYLAARENGEVE